MDNQLLIFQELDELLQRACKELQIGNAHYEQAKTSYMAVADWLATDEERFPDSDIDIYPQGSLRIGTTVKPLHQQEFDLDLVCELKLDWKSFDNPIEVLDAIESRLKENQTYKKMVEKKNRCIRLNYKRDFHMDILPACPIKDSDNGCVKVPDRKLEDWKDSNPRGYAKWFDNIAENYIEGPTTFLFEKAAKIEKLPYVEPVEIKPPLKRAVQLIKRYRDIYYKENIENAPISIVLTTIAGIVYQRQGSVNDTITCILNGIIEMAPEKGILKVQNPMNAEELLSERWETNPDLYNEFISFIQEFRDKWEALNTSIGSKGIVEISEILKEMFGEEPINKGFEKAALFNESLRDTNKLGITSAGVVVATSLPKTSLGATRPTINIKKNTFFGD
ncbi:nucleotidyltransferase domain-containing protein [Priestia megaterium]|uniref:nucleotidyltransferase domain-containing protein n=1 Tax=Priestia megaterium TaxID=1404 RepID=UPI001F462FA4|nr:nucleotidyltransferase [Priestia megaterium]